MLRRRRRRRIHDRSGGRVASAARDRQTARVDARLAALNERVAAAADAWLTDPADPTVYGLFVRAIRERRAQLATLAATPSPAKDADDLVEDVDALADDAGRADPEDADADQGDPDDVDALADRSPVQTLRLALGGTDPREVLDRLRGAR
jgi:hypothetical protein